MTRFTAIVALVFATERTSANKYDLWDIQIPIEADGPKSALFEAISRVRNSRNGEFWVILIDRSCAESGHCMMRRLWFPSMKRTIFAAG